MLIIRISRGASRLALFQAKRLDAQCPRVLDVHQNAPAIGAPPYEELGERPSEPQFIRLIAYALAALEAAGLTTSEDLRELRWVHYLAYTRSGIGCFSVNGVEDVLTTYAQREPMTIDRANSVPIPPLDDPSVTHLHEPLARGADDDGTPLQPADGWCTLSDAQMRAAMLTLLPYVSVFEAIDSAHGPSERLLAAAFCTHEHVSAITRAGSRRVEELMVASRFRPFRQRRPTRRHGTSARMCIFTSSDLLSLAVT